MSIGPWDPKSGGKLTSNDKPVPVKPFLPGFDRVRPDMPKPSDPKPAAEAAGDKAR